MQTNGRHLVFWGTLASLAVISGSAYLHGEKRLPQKIDVRAEGQPTMGNPQATVQVVVFEEPKCPFCKKFTNQVYPRIKEKYIDTNQIRYTVIPVSFLKGSMPAATALFCVYQRYGSESFFTLLNYIYQNQPPESEDWATFETMQRMAGEVIPGVVDLRSCMEGDQSRKQIEQNTGYGNEVMGHLITPGIYINGVKPPDSTFESTDKLIESALNQNRVSMAGDLWFSAINL